MPREIAAETFPALPESEIRHAFLIRVPGLDVATDRTEALARLAEYHRRTRADLGFPASLVTAEQVHGHGIAAVDAGNVGCVSSVDGLISNCPAIALGIYVADCCAVYLYDAKRRAIGLIHSGKKGTEMQIVSRAIRQMAETFGTEPGNLIVQLSPCIRPPDYEVDFVSAIIGQCRAVGVTSIFDAGKNTAADLQRYYSYRAERGQTGRMLALLALR